MELSLRLAGHRWVGRMKDRYREYWIILTLILNRGTRQRGSQKESESERETEWETRVITAEFQTTKKHSANFPKRRKLEGLFMRRFTGSKGHVTTTDLVWLYLCCALQENWKQLDFSQALMGKIITHFNWSWSAVKQHMGRCADSLIISKENKLHAGSALISDVDFCQKRYYQVFLC